MNRIPDACRLCGHPIKDHQLLDSVVIPAGSGLSPLSGGSCGGGTAANRYRCPSGRGIIVIAYDELPAPPKPEEVIAELRERNLVLINLLCYIKEVMRCGCVIENYMTVDPRPVCEMGTVWKKEKLDKEIDKALSGQRNVKGSQF